jgi:hypothetical protein
MLKVNKLEPVRGAIEKGLEKLRKWYMRIDESDTYFICLGMHCFIIKKPLQHYLIYFLALHPSIKLDYCKTNWDKDFFKAGTDALEKVVNIFN